MWSFARYHLRLSDRGFFALTPKQFADLKRQHRNHVESTELLFAQLTSWVANTGFRTTDKPVSTVDFMPSQWHRSAPANATHLPATKPIRMTAKRRAEVANGLRGLFPRR